MMCDLPTLNICVNSQNEELLNMYKNKIEQHNYNVRNNRFPDSGFDLFTPENIDISANKVTFVDLKVKTMMEKNLVCVGFQIYPRSSMSKMPIMLANHVGIIDSGYRGNIKAAVRGFEDYTIEKHSRFVQVCHPSLCPFYVKLVEENELSETSRGSRGFGSTGR
jgi:dUTP pyrophosphatase